MAAQTFFEDVTVTDIFDICRDTQVMITHLTEWGLIPREGEFKCETCGGIYKLVPDNSRIDNVRWKCSNVLSMRKQKRKQCSSTKTLRYGTFFANSHLEIRQILGFVDLWVDDVKLKTICRQMKISEQTGVDWASFCREVLLDKFLLHPEKLGGPGRIVELDESKFGKRKYHRGHRVEGQWVFGGFERDSGRIFMVTVEDRSADTLIPIIKDWILPGTTIISDFWKSYDCLDREGYIHLKVNHSVTFKDPETGAHTNHIECSWRHAKSIISSSGRRKYHLPGNLARYMFNKACGMKGVSRTIEFFKIAGNLYNPANPTPLPERDPEEMLDGSDLE